MDKFKNWMIDTASIMFKEDGNPDLEPAKKQRYILLQLSFVWSVIFSIYVFQYETMALGFGSVMLAHVLLIFWCLLYFQTVSQREKNDQSLQSETKTAEYSPLN